MAHLSRVMWRLAPLALALALGLFPSDGGHSTAYAQTPPVVGVATVPPAGGRTLVTAGTADIQALIDAQLFAVESVWLFDVQAQRFLAFIVGGPAFVNTLTSLSPTDIVTLKAAAGSPTNPSPAPTEVQVEGLTDLARSYLASIGWAESEAAAIARLARQSTVRVIADIGGGGAGWVAAPGYVITNEHVVRDHGSTFTIVTLDGSSYTAIVVAQSPSTPSGQLYDLALLEVIDPAGFPAPLPLGDPVLGEPVLAIGHPSIVGNWVVTVGEVTEALHTEVWTLSDVAGAPGSSGGPVVNRRGEVIGPVSGGITFGAPPEGVYEQLIIRSLTDNQRPSSTSIVHIDGVRQLLEEYGLLLP